MMPVHPPPYSPDSEIERKVRYEEEHPRQIEETDGSKKRRVLSATIGIAAVVVVIGVVLYGLFVGF